MARFVTSIQLHNAAEADYEKLNTELERSAFKSIKKDRRWKKESSTSPREYNREGNITLHEVTDAVVKAIAKTGKQYSFTIIRNKPAYS